MHSEALRSRSRGAGSGASMHALLDASNVVAVLCVSAAGRVVSVNHALALALGADSTTPLIGRNLAEDVLADAADWSCWRDADASGAAENVELRLRRADGRDTILRGDIRKDTDAVTGEPLLVGLFVDVTNVRNLEGALQRSARMEALSALVTGAVHDFNNILTVLIGNLYLVAEGLRENPGLFDKVKAARDVARRGADLIKQLLSFARQAPTPPGRVDVAGMVSKLEPLLARAVGSAVELRTAIATDVAAAEGNGALLESAIVNLVVNARDALEGRGRVTIELANALLDPVQAARLDVAPGQYVRIAVVDDGPGIGPELQQRVFEPFFTTKGDNGGTGLGLSMVRRMAEQSHGAVELASTLGQGTSISILLPRSDAGTSESMIKTMPLSTLPAGDENVVLIADDQEILATIQQILNVLGYAVRTTSDPRELGELMRSAAPDLVIVDNTAAAAAKAAGATTAVRKLAPQVRFLYIDDAAGARKAGSQRNLLLKPFSLMDLASAVRKTLDGDTSE